MNWDDSIRKRIDETDIALCERDAVRSHVTPPAVDHENGRRSPRRVLPERRRQGVGDTDRLTQRS